MYSRVVIAGNAVDNPKVIQTQGGKLIATFNVAINKHGKDANGQPTQKTTFIEVVAFGRLAEIARNYVFKGDKIMVDGELNQELWVGKDGIKRSKHNILCDKLVLISSKPKNSNSTNTQAQPQPKPQAQSYKEASLEDIPDEDIPF